MIFLDFNRRVIECRLSALLLTKYKTGKVLLDAIPTLKEVQTTIYDVSLERMMFQLDYAFARPNKQPNEIFSRKEVCEMLDITDETFAEKILGQNTQEVQEFNLYDRAEHVFTEALRVEKFKNICDENSGDNTMTKLGLLMDGSHWSCSKKYECSSTELDELTTVARNNGALGSRLTGAGWGGCSGTVEYSVNFFYILSYLKKNIFNRS